jgi:arginase
VGDMNLFFPQWQGGGNRSLYTGAAAARKGLNLKSRLSEIKMASGETLAEEHDIKGYRQILEQLHTIHDKIAEEQPGSIFTLGGGCDIELAPISYLNKKYEGDLTVLWMDAHGDLNSPAGSQSKLFHGMPLRILLEDGHNEEIDKLCFSKLTPEQVLLLGVRDLDPAETEYIAEKNMHSISAEDLIWTDPMDWISKLKTNVYIHIDLDILDGEKYPYTLCRSDHGLQTAHLVKLIDMLQDERRIVGLSLLEYASSDPTGSQELKQIAAVGLWI